MIEGLKGVKVRILHMGCRTNLFESEALGCAFREAGALTPRQGSFDAAVVVTCSVTSEADRKCRQIIRRLRREGPEALIVAAGCWAQRASPGEARELGVDCLVGNRLKHRIPAVVAEMLGQGPPSAAPRVFRADVQGELGWEPLSLSGIRTRTRAFVKIQDGCDHRCSYCIIPDLRGRPVDRPGEDILKEVRILASSGCAEVVFTGVNLGLFGRSRGTFLGEIVRKTAEVEGIKRIRFGSIEPFCLDEPLLEILAGTSQFCPHLHVPLQSGDADILRRMNRGYTPEEFEVLIEKARSFLGEDLHWSTDIIVGFPGEGEEAFDGTLEMLQKMRVGKLHAFPFSAREGTPAGSFEKPVPPDEIRSRMDRALAVGSELLGLYSRRWVGKDVEVLVERNQEGTFAGLSRHYLRFEARGDKRPGEIAAMTVKESIKGTLLG
ncbi:MAG TPA: MiaB/RimO family radical SAM methylthiotransferase [Synergistales bacterium]|nr:MiaB/RimO family radical SAM methylthiotransferase [Synergistales bacterium]HRS48141.1 MiaB/RimO family radical SAM methylthiotransferase [Thermovirgaceae bacterium]HRU90665.1 MiaB/RimO family radical SAM methylthiotransferase [Thermovirgaceae bacterium]